MMFYTKNPLLNKKIDDIHQRIQQLVDPLIMTEQPGFKSINYGQSPGMKSVLMYIIVYDQKANLGFPHGVLLQTKFPCLKGTGKMHRHLEINEKLTMKTVEELIKEVLKLKII